MPNNALKRKTNWVLLAVIVVLLLGGVLRFILAANYGYEYDVREYKRFALKTALNGAFDLYMPDKFADVDYPPLLPWMLVGLDQVFGGLGPGQIKLFRMVLGGLVTAADLGFCVLLFFLARPRGQKAALAALTVWAFNPQSIFDTGYWSQVNSLLIFVIGLSIFMVVRKKPMWAGIIFGIACLLKPQAWMLTPALFLWIFHEFGWKKGRDAVLAAILPLVLVWLGFLFAGRAPTLRLMISGVESSNSSITYNAHNLWWFAQVLNSGKVFSDQSFLFMTYGQASWILTVLGLFTIAVFWVKNYRHRRGGNGVQMLALWAAAFFLLAPHMHENHAMLALGLLAAAWALGQKVGWQLVIATALILGNCALHDHQLLRALFPNSLEGWQTLVLTSEQTIDNTSTLTVILAALSLILTTYWAIIFLFRKSENLERITSE
jgi:dolichyl-phosphate-mannose-protein mannosyltransferase